MGEVMGEICRVVLGGIKITNGRFSAVRWTKEKGKMNQTRERPADAQRMTEAAYK